MTIEHWNIQHTVASTRSATERIPLESDSTSSVYIKGFTRSAHAKESKKPQACCTDFLAKRTSPPNLHLPGWAWGSRQWLCMPPSVDCARCTCAEEGSQPVRPTPIRVYHSATLNFTLEVTGTRISFPQVISRKLNVSCLVTAGLPKTWA